MKRWLTGALAALIAGGAATAEDLRFFTLGSGELDGGYHRAARAICSAVNRAQPGRMRCSPETTPGSRYNIHALSRGALDLGIVQADVAARALTGGATGLRLAARLHEETLTVLAGPEARVERLSDLAGRRVDIGPPASGRHATARVLFAALGLGGGGDVALEELPGATSVQALCDGRIDAAVFILGHPSALVERALACGAALAPVDGDELERLLAAAPYLRRTRIPVWRYAALEAPVETAALRAELLARAETPDEVVSAVARALLAEAEAIGRAAPILAQIGAGSLAENGVVPLHPGAAAVYADR